MSVRHWLSGLCSRYLPVSSHAGRRRTSSARRLQLESLEGRALLATAGEAALGGVEGGVESPTGPAIVVCIPAFAPAAAIQGQVGPMGPDIDDPGPSTPAPEPQDDGPVETPKPKQPIKRGGGGGGGGGDTDRPAGTVTVTLQSLNDAPLGPAPLPPVDVADESPDERGLDGVNEAP